MLMHFDALHQFDLFTSRLADLLSFGVRMPLLWYLLLWLAVTIAFIWFGFVYKDQGKELKETRAALTDACAELDTQDKELDAKDEELDELNHNYATVALMLEDQHSAIVDLQTITAQQDRRMDIMSDRLTGLHERTAYSQLAAQNDYTGPDDEEPYASPSEQPPTWIKEIKGLDEL